MELTDLWWGAVWSWLLAMAVGALVSQQKGRRPVEGFLLGFLLSWIGVIVAAVLPTEERRHQRSRDRDHVVGREIYFEDRARTPPMAVFLRVVLFGGVVAGVVYYFLVKSGTVKPLL
jgi:hypothetical protein